MLVYSSIYLNYVPAAEKFSIYVKICGALVFTFLVLIYSKVVRCVLFASFHVLFYVECRIIFFSNLQRGMMFCTLQNNVMIFFFLFFPFSTTQFEDSELIGTRFGLILTSLHYVMFLAPFHGIAKAVQLKCTKFLPLPMIVTGTLVGFSWLLHGFIVKSVFIIVRMRFSSKNLMNLRIFLFFQAQNLFIQLINLIQLSLFILYPSEPVPVSKEKKQKLR